MNRIFDYLNKIEEKNYSPLAFRMRPSNIDDIIGQKHILGINGPLRKMIEKDILTTIILYGPSGSGKTTIAQVIAKTTNANFIKINAVTASKSDMVKAVEEAKKQKTLYSDKTILFIDEIHRFNKAQQDYLLPFVEDGTINMIGATTENPYFEVNPALISRSVIFRLHRLNNEESEIMINKTLEFYEKNENKQIKISDEARKALVNIAAGDARKIINTIELGFILYDGDTIEICQLNEILQCSHKGALQKDNHYDNASAFIKSVRGSDPDAALYYLARMIDSGEDPKFIARRMMILASEDIGNADPMALILATNTGLAVERVGMPESSIILANAATYLAQAPKSNASYVGIKKALEITKNSYYNIPAHLRDANYNGAKNMGYGIGYKYPHDYKNNYVEQDYLPKEIKNIRLYDPTDNGYENTVKANLKRRKINE